MRLAQRPPFPYIRELLDVTFTRVRPVKDVIKNGEGRVAAEFGLIQNQEGEAFRRSSTYIVDALENRDQRRCLWL